MSKPSLRRETVDTVVRHVGAAYGLDPEQAEQLADRLWAIHGQPATPEVALLQQEVAELRAVVGLLLARPVCPHAPRA